MPKTEFNKSPPQTQKVMRKIKFCLFTLSNGISENFGVFLGVTQASQYIFMLVFHTFQRILDPCSLWAC